jgi:PAS domain S-box-containing protein
MSRADGGRSRGRSATTRLFTKYAAITLVPMLALGVALALTLGAEARQRGLAQGRAEARLVAQTAVEPILAAHPLRRSLSGEERLDLEALVRGAVHDKDILRLRVHALSGAVVFSDDGSGFRGKPDDEALEAARGATVVSLTHLNSDSDDIGGKGPASVEVYEPLYVGAHRVRVGVLELYLPYAPIAADVASSLHRLYLDIAGGLALLYLALLGITLSITRGLRRQLAVNATQAEQLRARAHEHRMLFEDNPLPMIAYDRDSLQIVAVSNTACERYGWTREEFLGMTLSDVRPPEEAARLLRRAELDRTPHEAHEPLQTRHRYKDGTIVDVELATHDLTVAGRSWRLALCQDVTARNKATSELAIARDAAIEASNMKSAFLANVSHEIRTPMNGVLGMTELLLETRLDDAQREYAEQVASSGEHMLAIINDILDISKIETGRLELDATDFELREMVEKASAVGRIEARQKGVGFVVVVDEAVPARVRGDGGRLRQVLMNLVGNAVKFTSNGAVRIAVSALGEQADRTRLRFEVADDGIGIPAERLEHMFEPFTQADVSTTRKYGGTGLGLAIARELVELMGGEIGAESEPGAGSSFWFEVELEQAAAAADEGAEVEHPVAAGELGESAPIVLVVDDTPVNQIVAVRALARCGCRADVAGNGSEALDALLARRYDAVLMDCQMPEMDGYAATHELRQREVGGRRTPVIAMTAAAMKGDLDRCIACGMDDFVSKPLRHRVLEEALLRWIPELRAAA